MALFEKPLFYNVKKVPVESCINDTNQDLGGPVPIFVDSDKSTTH